MVLRRLAEGYRNLKLKYKLILIFSMLSAVSLTGVSTVSVSLYRELAVKNENRAVLENLNFFKTNLNSYLYNVEAFSSSIILSSEVQSALGRDLEALPSGERMEAYLSVYGKLQEIYRNTYGVDSILIIGRYENVFKIDTVTSGGQLVSGGEFTDPRWGEQAERLRGAPYWTIIEMPQGDTLIGMVRLIKDSGSLYAPNSLGSCLITISPHILSGYLDSSRFGEGGYCLIDSGGAVYAGDRKNSGELMALADELPPVGEGYLIREYDGREYVVTYSHDPSTDWMFAHVIDKALLLGDIDRIGRICLALLAATVLAAAGLSVLISGSVSSPLRRLMGLIGEVERGNLTVRFDGAGLDEVGVLGRSFNRMVERIRRGIPLRREKLLRSLLTDSLTGEEYAKEAAELGLSFEGEQYQVALLLTREPPGEEQARRVEYEVTAMERSRGGVLTAALGSGEYCVISSLPREETADLVRELQRTVEERTGIRLFACFGSSYGSLHFVRDSFQEARELIRYRFYHSGGDWMGRDFIDDNHWNMEYPEPLENRLLHSLREGDARECGEILEQALRFFRENSTDPAVVNAFAMSVYMELYKESARAGVPGAERIVRELFGAENLQYMEKPVEEMLDILRKVIEAVLPMLREEEPRNLSASVRRAAAIIGEEYQNPELSVEYVSRRVHLNENYLSRLFKKELGVGFADYVSALRLERAKELLRDEKVKIKDIHSRVGFTSAHYFGAWFKKNTGVTPSQFRKQ